MKMHSLDLSPGSITQIQTDQMKKPQCPELEIMRAMQEMLVVETKATRQ